jgi:hypothetical protein
VTANDPHGGHARPGPQDPHAAHGPHDPHPAAMPAELAALLAEIVPPGGAFRHREHVHLAYIAVQRYGTDAAEKVAGWIRHLAASQGAPQKFHATVTRAWVEIVAHHMMASPPAADFATFAARYPALLDKRLLTRHYSSRALASPAARTGWLEPDLAGFPWAS